MGEGVRGGAARGGGVTPKKQRDGEDLWYAGRHVLEVVSWLEADLREHHFRRRETP